MCFQVFDNRWGVFAGKFCFRRNLQFHGEFNDAQSAVDFFWNKSPEGLSKLTPSHKLYEVSLLLIPDDKNKIVTWVPVVNTARVIAANINLYRITQDNESSHSCLTIMTSAEDECGAIKIAKIHRDFLVYANATGKIPSKDYAELLGIDRNSILF